MPQGPPPAAGTEHKRPKNTWPFLLAGGIAMVSVCLGLLSTIVPAESLLLLLKWLGIVATLAGVPSGAFLVWKAWKQYRQE
jgi:uncharacterized membrane protein HdeD (DUF308 family)